MSIYCAICRELIPAPADWTFGRDYHCFTCKAMLKRAMEAPPYQPTHALTFMCGPDGCEMAVEPVPESEIWT